MKKRTNLYSKSQTSQFEESEVLSLIQTRNIQKQHVCLCRALNHLHDIKPAHIWPEIIKNCF